MAQYPTPLVPDYYTKSGHIILVVKESIEKGNYNPKPLDGSVTYTGRDADIWPSTLYLVYQQPTPDGEYVYSTYANDRTLASQNPWNYGLDYSGNSPSHPITSRTYIVPRSQYATVALGSTDPVFGGTQIISGQKMIDLGEESPLRSRYVAVQRIYESIPGPVVRGKRLNPRGDIETVEVQTVTAGTAPTPDGLLVTETKVDAVDSVKSTKTTATVQSHAQLTVKSNKSGLLGNTSTTDNIVSPATNPDALSTTILESTVEQLTGTKARKRTTTSTGPTLLSGFYKKEGLLGEAKIEESIVEPNASPEALSTLVVSSEITPIDSGKAKKTTITASGPTLLGGKTQKSGLLGITTETESIVVAGSEPDELSISVLQSTVTPIDNAKSKKTTIEADGPTLLSGIQYKAGLLGLTTKEESIVEYGSSPDPLSISVLDSSVEPIDEHKSKKTTISSDSPTELDGKTIGEFGLITTAESIVQYGSELPEPNTSTVKLEKAPIDLAKSKLVDASYDSLNTLTGYQYDPDLDLVVTNTKKIISPNTELVADDGLISSRDEPIDVWKTIRIQSRISQLPSSRTEYKTGSYSSPNLLTGFTNTVFNFPDGQIQYNVTPVMRAERSYQTVFKYVTTYEYGQPDAPSETLFDPLSINVIYKGFFFSINIPNCLTNPLLKIRFFTGINTPAAAYYGVIDETYTVPTSDTTATEYNALVGTYQLISYEIDYWKANIWRKSETSVLLK